MAHRYENLVRDTGSTGTGTWTLVGSPPTGYRAFSTMSDDDTCDYVAYTMDGSNAITALELGVGTVGSSGTTLARTSITFSTNANSAVDFATGPTIEVIASARFFSRAALGQVYAFGAL